MFYSWHAQFSTGRPWKSSQVGQQGSLKGGPFGIAALAIWFFSSKGRNARRHKETTQGLPAMLSRSKARAMVKLSTLAGLSDSQVAQSADNSVLGGGGERGCHSRPRWALHSSLLPSHWAGLVAGSPVQAPLPVCCTASGPLTEVLWRLDSVTRGVGWTDAGKKELPPGSVTAARVDG